MAAMIWATENQTTALQQLCLLVHGTQMLLQIWCFTVTMLLLSFTQASAWLCDMASEGTGLHPAY